MNSNTNISEEEIDLIERYVLGDMTPEEEEAFKLTLSNDIELQSKADEVKLLLLGVNEAILLEKLNDFHKELPGSGTKSATGKIALMRNWLVAASVILLVGITGWWFFFSNNKQERIFTEYFKPDPGLITAMSTSDNYVFDRAMIDYKTGNYDSAIKAWEGLLSKKPENDTLNYFTASAYLALNKSAKAIPHFNKVVTITDSYFFKDACWYLGLALLKENKKEEAISFIEKTDHERKQDLLLRLKE